MRFLLPWKLSVSFWSPCIRLLAFFNWIVFVGFQAWAFMNVFQFFRATSAWKFNQWCGWGRCCWFVGLDQQGYFKWFFVCIFRRFIFFCVFVILEVQEWVWVIIFQGVVALRLRVEIQSWCCLLWGRDCRWIILWVIRFGKRASFRPMRVRRCHRFFRVGRRDWRDLGGLRMSSEWFRWDWGCFRRFQEKRCVIMRTL